MKEKLYLFVGTYADSAEEGIYLYHFDPVEGEASLLKTISGIENPSYLTVDSRGERLYVVSETTTPRAIVAAYSLDLPHGKIELLNKVETCGSSPCFIWLESRGRLAVTANYRGGSISVFPITANGKLSSAKVYDYTGRTPQSKRQEAPHLHCVYASPDEKYVFANDLGTDRIYAYELVRARSGSIFLKERTEAFLQLPAGEGPRHTVFHPNGKWAYLIGELSGRVTVFRYEEGELVPIQSIEADPCHAQGSADIRLTPDGRFLYVSNRLEEDGLAIFSVHPQTGMLTPAGYQPTAIHPRNFIITPDNNWLLCACRDSNIIQVFKINRQTGLLQNVQKNIELPRPVCLHIV